MARLFAILVGVLGALAVGLGAFGAHGLEKRLAALPDGARRAEWWSTAAHYHLTHVLALAFVAWLADRGTGTPSTVAGACLVGGIVVFSGSLYAMTLTGMRALGAITPIGGLLLIVGWIAVAIAAARLR